MMTENVRDQFDTPEHNRELQGALRDAIAAYFQPHDERRTGDREHTSSSRVDRLARVIEAVQALRRCGARGEELEDMFGVLAMSTLPEPGYGPNRRKKSARILVLWMNVLREVEKAGDGTPEIPDVRKRNGVAERVEAIEDTEGGKLRSTLDEQPEPGQP